MCSESGVGVGMNHDLRPVVLSVEVGAAAVGRDVMAGSLGEMELEMEGGGGA